LRDEQARRFHVIPNAGRDFRGRATEGAVADGQPG